MKKAKHTEGPWSVDEPSECSWYIWSTVGKELFICQMPTEFGQSKASIKRHQQNEVNARLIAAAPELLEACEMVIDAAIGDKGQEIGQYIDWPALRQAIAKATGEEE